MTTASPEVLGLSGPRDLMKCVEENFQELDAEPATRRLINCVVLLNHMVDWVWYGWLHNDVGRCRQLGLSPSGARTTIIFEDFQGWVEKACPSAKIVREVANGAKHLREPSRRPPTQVGYQATALIGIGIPHHEASWWITLDGRTETIFWGGSNAGTALHDTLKYWRDFLAERTAWT